MTSPFPRPQYLVAFNNNPTDDPALIAAVAAPGVLGANNVWTDITQWVSSHSITRGRQHELDQFNAGTLSLTLDNTTNIFSPWNAAGAFYGFLLPRKLIQVRATWAGTTYTRFTGHTTSWGIDWADPISNMATVEAADAFRLLGSTYMVSEYSQVILAANPVMYWRLDDNFGTGGYASRSWTTGPNVFVMADASGHGNTGYVTNGPAYLFAQPGLIAGDPDTALGMPIVPGSTNQPFLFYTSYQAAPLTLEFWVSFSPGLAAGGAYVVGGGGSPAFALNLVAGVLQMAGTTTLNTAAVCDGNPHYVAIMIAAGGGSFSVCLDGVIYGPVAMTGYVATNLTIWAVQSSVSLTGTMTVDEVAMYPTVLSAATLAAHYLLGLIGLPQQQSGARIAAALTAIGWPAGAQVIDAGNSTIQANQASNVLTNVTILSHLQTIEETEGGSLFMDVAGRVRFVGRRTVMNTAPFWGSQLTFGDTPSLTEIPFQPGSTIQIDDLDIYPIARGTRQGGSIQQVVNAPAVAAEGPQTWQPQSTLLMTTDAEMLQRCQLEVAKYAYPQVRVEEFAVTLSDLIGDTFIPNAVAQMLAMELLTMVTINRHTVGFSQLSRVEGIGETVTADSWVITCNLSTPADSMSFWILADPTYGVLGTTTRLAY